MLDNIQFDEEQPDVQDIMRQIQAYIAEREPGEAGEGPSRPQLSGTRFSPAVYEQLDQAIQASDKVQVQPTARPVQVPIVGPLLSRLREMFHGLVIYYLGLLAARQISYNVHAAQALKALVADLEADPALSDGRVAELEARVAQLEARLFQLNNGSGESTQKTP